MKYLKLFVEMFVFVINNCYMKIPLSFYQKCFFLNYILIFFLFYQNLYKFDVVNKAWEIIPVNPELWPLLIYHRPFTYFRCVQSSEKPNLINLFDTSFGGI